VEVERIGKDGDYGFAFGFLVDGRQAEICIDKNVYDAGKRAGLNGLDGVPLSLSSDSHEGQLLLQNRPVHFSLTVHRRSIKLTCEGSTIVDWRGDPRRLIRFVHWHVPDHRSLFLCSGSLLRFRKMVLTPLTAAGQ
jgi:hypothetical protein